MPRANSSSKKDEKDKKPVEVEKLLSFSIISAREGKSERGDWILATVKINGVTIYGCRPVTYKTKDGKEADFLSFPEEKVGDKYYKRAYIPLSSEDQQTICNAIYKALDEK